MGIADRLVRIMAALIIAALWFANIITGTLAYILLVAAGIFALTAFFGLCLLYLPFKFKTFSKKQHKFSS